MGNVRSKHFGHFGLKAIKSFVSVIVMGVVVGGLTIASAKASVILEVDDNGQLVGASGVDLGRLGLFNVRFLDGSCVGLFGGCDELSDFDFTIAEDVALAAQALLDQVFIDSAAGNFDTIPSNTFGCEDPTEGCRSLIPFNFTTETRDIVSLGLARNELGIGSADDISTTNVSFIGTDFSSSLVEISGSVNYVRFDAVAISVVPLPPAALLFGTALLGLAGLGKRRRKA